jgi:hypothetical protein
MDFAPAAAAALFSLIGNRSAIFVELDAMPRAKGGTDPARFAPIAKDIDFVSLLNLPGPVGSICLRLPPGLTGIPGARLVFLGGLFGHCKPL